MDSDLVDYIRKNRDIYTTEAINQRLLEEYSAKEISDAWQLVEQQEASEVENNEVAESAQPYAVAGAAPTRVSAGFVVLYIFIIIIGVLLVLLTDLVFAFSHYNPAIGTAETLVNVLSVAAGVGLLVGGLMLLRRGWPVGRVSALITVLALFWYLVVAGTCLYAPSALR